MYAMKIYRNLKIISSFKKIKYLNNKILLTCFVLILNKLKPITIYSNQTLRIIKQQYSRLDIKFEFEK